MLVLNKLMLTVLNKSCSQLESWESLLRIFRDIKTSGNYMVSETESGPNLRTSSLLFEQHIMAA